MRDGTLDRLATLGLFARIVERGSFTAAAADLGVSRPVATAAIKELEQRLGTRLLQRSTRHIQATAEGQAYYRRCVAILADLEDADRGASGAVAGLLRVDVAGNIASTMLFPALPAFLALHPALKLHFNEGERLVDLVREGVDCVVRAGTLPDSEMISRHLGEMVEVTVASPAYLAQHGTPHTPEDVHHHQMIGFVSSRTGQAMPLEFTRGTEVIEITPATRVLVGGANTAAAAALIGLGITQAPRYRFESELASGALVEILREYSPTPTRLSVLYPSNRQLSPRVRVFVDWLVETIGSRLRPIEDREN